MKRDDIRHPTLREKIIRRDREQNPNHRPLGGREACKPQPPPAPALEDSVKKLKVSKGCLVVCTLIAHRRRLLDDDNCTASLKPLRDGISESIGVDDGDQRIKWQCGHVLTLGKEGETVTIERIYENDHHD